MATITEDYKEKLKEALNSDNTDYEVVRWIEQNFPELKENEDEQHRKWILEYLYDGLRKSDEQFKDHFKAALAWLKKQGEQKPKFRVGDTIKCKYDDRQFTIKSVNLDKGTYTYTQEGCGNDIDYADEDFELVEQKSAFETKTPEESLGIDSETYNEIVDECIYGELKPADKAEPKFKVKYAGSEYNVFEVKDIAGVTYYGIEDEPNHIDYVFPDNCEIVSGYSYGVKEKGSPYPTKSAIFSEQKPAWSEEELDSITAAINNLEYLKNNYTYHQMGLEPAITFLKSLKERVQPKQEWSEEDERIINDLVSQLGNLYARKLIKEETKDKYVTWLKSIRPQNTWKPSDEQMKVCKEVYADILSAKGFDLGTVNGELNRLEEQLKKLREE